MIDRIYALRKSLHNYANGGYVLIAVTVLAMIVANSPLHTLYFSWWEQPVKFQIGGFNLFEHHGHPMTLMQVINDALMAVFFFSVGLEIKREVLVGELSSLRKALLPVIAAVGGIIIPITIYRLMSTDAAILQGSAIPMATDIAFSLGILSMFGKRVPIGLKIFLATLAVADDIGGILVIAIFYTEELSAMWLLYSAGVLAVMLLGARLHINSKLFYLFGALVVWYFFLHSGIHPTIAGVLDQEAWVAYQGKAPLTDSLNLKDVDTLFADIPQIHYVGEQDKVVPPALTEAFVSDPTTVVVVPKATHTKGFQSIYPAIYQER